MIGIVIVSHSPKIAEGTKDLAEQMCQGNSHIFAAGGVDDTTIGTNPDKIHKAIKSALAVADGVLVLVDLGSAVMSAETAIDMLSEDERKKIRKSQAPLVEGSIIAAVEASLGNSLDEVTQAAEMTRQLEKFD